MGRSIPIALVDHFKTGVTTNCYLLKIVPLKADIFGITSLDADVTYDDGSGDGAIVYRAVSGYTPSDHVAASDMSVDNEEANALLAQYPLDGVTTAGIGRGDYDGASFVQYIVNYEDLSSGHVVVASGRTGDVRQVDDVSCVIELRSLTQILKQQSVIELVSITCRAGFGDDRCKLDLAWSAEVVATIGAESDRSFTLVSTPDGFKLPGVIRWTSGDNTGREQEIEDYDTDTGLMTLLIPAYSPIQAGDGLDIRRDCDKSKAMCIEYENYPNFRGEPETPRANGTDLQAPTPSAS